MAIDPNDPNATAFGGQSAFGALLQWLQSQGWTPPSLQNNPAAGQTLQNLTTPPPQQPAQATEPTPSAPEPVAPGTPPDVGGPVQGPQEVRQPTIKFNPQDPTSINQVWQTAQSQFDQAQTDLQTLTDRWNQTWAQYQAFLQDPSKFAQLQQLTPVLTQLQSQVVSAQQRMAQANVNLANVQVAAMDKLGLQPAQVKQLEGQSAQETAQASYLDAQAKTLLAAAPTQLNLVNAQVNETNARAQGDTAQANVWAAQADQIRQQTGQLLPAQTAQTAAQAALLQAQAVGLTPAQAAQALAQAQNISARTPAEVGLLGAQTTGALGAAAQNVAQAQSLQAGIQQNLLGNLYGMSDRVNAIRAIQQQAFSQPGKTPDEMTADANQMLQDYVNATIGGTTPAAAATLAGNLAQQGFGTQAGMYNAAAAAQAARANAYQAFGGNVLSTLAQMNVNAPKGSTLLQGAFEDVMNQMANRMNAPQFAAPQQPTPPQMPAFLQRFAASQSAQAPGQTPVTINIGQSGPTQAGTPNPSSNPFDWYSAWQARQAADVTQQQAAAAMGGGGTAGQTMPSVLQGYAPATVDSLHGQWSNELNSGAVTSPLLG